MSTKNTLMAFLGGAAIGAVVALLFAPEKGEVTRRKIGKAVNEGRDRAMEKFNEGREAIEEAYRKGRRRVSDAYHEGREKLADAISEGRELVADELETLCDDAEKTIRGK